MIIPDDNQTTTCIDPARRKTLNCLAAWTGAAVLWSLVGGVPRALGATTCGGVTATSKHAFTFVQISDTHIGFHQPANPDVVGSLRRAIADINALARAPALVVHTGDVSHLSRPGEFGQARELLAEIRVDRVHTIPGEHDAIDDGLTGYLKFFDHDGKNRPWYSCTARTGPGTAVMLAPDVYATPPGACAVGLREWSCTASQLEGATGPQAALHGPA